MDAYSWIYQTSPDNSFRFSLGHCSKSPILCIGVNPSTASPENPDSTIRSVKRIARANSYGGWIMINLYPQRSTNPNDLPSFPDENACRQNLIAIQSILSDYDIPEIWAAWGGLIKKRPFLARCLSDIYSISSDYRWITFGPRLKGGHPHHPLYLRTDSPKEDFDMEAYLVRLGRR